MLRHAHLGVGVDLVFSSFCILFTANSHICVLSLSAHTHAATLVVPLCSIVHSSQNGRGEFSKQFILYLYLYWYSVIFGLGCLFTKDLLAGYFLSHKNM